MTVKTPLAFLTLLFATLSAPAQEFLGPPAPPPAAPPAAANPVGPTPPPNSPRPPGFLTRPVRTNLALPGGGMAAPTTLAAPVSSPGPALPSNPPVVISPTRPNPVVPPPAAVAPPVVPVPPSAAPNDPPAPTTNAVPFGNLMGLRDRTNNPLGGRALPAGRTNMSPAARAIERSNAMARVAAIFAGSNRPAATVPAAAVPPAPAPVPAPAPTTTMVTNADGTVAIVPSGQRPGAGGGASTNAAGATAAEDMDELIPSGLLKFSDTDLGQVLTIYGELANRVILRPATLPAQKITLEANKIPLTRREALQALDTILSLNGISTVKQDKKFIKILPEAQAPNAGGIFNTDPVESLPESASYVTRIVQLKYALPEEVMPILTPFAKLATAIVAVKSSQMLILRDNAENIKRMLELIEKVDINIPVKVKMVVIPIKYALAGDMQSVLSSLSSGGGGGGVSIGGGGGGGSGRLSSGGGGGFSGGMSGMGSTGMGGYGSGGMGGYGSGGYGGQRTTGMGTTGALGSSTTPGAAGTRGSFANRVGNIMRAGTAGASQGEIQILGNAKLIADERTNSLLVFAEEADLKEITNIISKLDVVLAQVLIEAVICDVSLGDDLSYGVSYLQNNPTSSGKFTGLGAGGAGKYLGLGSFGSSSSGTNGAASALASGFSYFGKWGNDLEATAIAVASDNRATVLARPRILTSHAKEAQMFVGQTVPYITGYYGGGGYYGGSAYSQYQQMQIGINLSVLPFINSEGLVVMDLHQRVQSVQGKVSINGNDVPITSDADSSAYVAVRDRETVVLGGYIRDERSKNASGVPLLKDIPVLGNLFRSTSKSNKRSEMLIFIRPTVLPTPEAAALATAEERDRAPAIRRAEMEVERSIRKDRERLNKKLDKADGN